ncbi:MAG: hypothetical protein ACKODX_17790 [Gemmata sp.]
MLRVLMGAAALGAAALLAGCGGPKGPAPATVSGQVKLNGVAIEKGIIMFAPADGVGAPATAEITKGRYTVATTAGKKAVQVSVPVVTGRQPESAAPGAPMIELTAESVPEKYNAKSELTLDVIAGGNTKDWDLEVMKK